MQWPDLANLDDRLIARYETRGPRYTSYPTAPHFTTDIDQEAFWARAAAAAEAPSPLSIYVHTPYCPNKCLYCGCHSVALSRPDDVSDYLSLVLRELALWRDRLETAGERRRVHAQLALGGGSPSTLGPEGLRRLVEAVDATFPPTPDAERSIEMDPSRVDETFLGEVVDLGFTRVSFGVQDFDPEVLRRVARREDPGTVARHTAYLRHRGLHAISFDLMVGLPGQTPARYAETLRRVIDLSPSRLALFPYAHVPWMMPHQRALEAWHLPTTRERLTLYGLAHERLGAAGYHPVGMDHFALEGDALVLASRERRLHRNFMGYTTRPDLDLIGLGVSAISDIGAAYAQITKDMASYEARLHRGEIPIDRGILLDRDDEMRREVIASILCNFEVRLDDVAARYDTSREAAFAEDLARLTPLVEDGLVTPPGSDGVLSIPSRGLPFARLVCMAFDRHLSPGGARYSTTL